MEARRLNNGVLARVDGGGDTWAGEHRQALSNQYFLQDLDAVAGVMAFGTNGVDRLFTEYEPDSYRNHDKLVRKFGVVALFDRKATLPACDRSVVSTAFYLHMARTFSLNQPIPVRFFYVVGQQEPWTLVEVDITTGERLGTTELANGTWRRAWGYLGLLNAREVLRAWLCDVETKAEPAS